MLTCAKCNKVYADKFKACPHCAGKHGIIGVLCILAIAGVVTFSVISSGSDKTPAADSTVTPEQFAAAEASLAKNLQDPQKAKLMECEGIQVYKDPQPPGFPPSAAECAQIERQANIPPASASSTDVSPATSGQQADESHTPPTDPYATGQKALDDKIYAQSKAALLDQVRTAQFALRCRVIGDTEANMIYLSGARRISDADLNAGRSDYHPDLLPAAKAAAAEVDARAQQSGACDYWQQHPEDVAEIRREAQMALAQ
jgi:hypothetical protein